MDFSTGSVAFTIMAIFTFTQLPAMVSDAILLFLGTLTSGLSTSISMSKAPMAPSSLDSISRLEALDACATLPELSSAGTAAGPWTRLRLRLLRCHLSIANLQSWTCRLLQHVCVWQQCLLKSMRIRSRTCSSFSCPAFFQPGSALVSVCEPPLPAHALHPAVGPNLSTTPRVKYTCRWACTVGKTLELYVPSHQSHLRTHVLPVFCMVSNPSSKMVYRMRLQPQCRTHHGKRGELGLSVVW